MTLLLRNKVTFLSYAQHTPGPRSATLHYDAYTLLITRAHALLIYPIIFSSLLDNLPLRKMISGLYSLIDDEPESSS
jgi:hypothetical protein